MCSKNVNLIRRYHVFGSRTLSNYWWGGISLVGGFSFFIVGLYSYYLNFFSTIHLASSWPNGSQDLASLDSRTAMKQEFSVASKEGWPETQEGLNLTNFLELLTLQVPFKQDVFAMQAGLANVQSQGEWPTGSVKRQLLIGMFPSCKASKTYINDIGSTSRAQSLTQNDSCSTLLAQRVMSFISPSHSVSFIALPSSWPSGLNFPKPSSWPCYLIGQPPLLTLLATPGSKEVALLASHAMPQSMIASQQGEAQKPSQSRWFDHSTLLHLFSTQNKHVKNLAMLEVVSPGKSQYDIKNPLKIAFFPQGLSMCFYGLIGVLLGTFVFFCIVFKIGSGFTEFNKEKGTVRIFRLGFPGKSRYIDYSYNLESIQCICVKISSSIVPGSQRGVYMRLKVSENQTRDIPLDLYSEKTSLEEIELQAADLSKFLRVSLSIL